MRNLNSRHSASDVQIYRPSMYPWISFITSPSPSTRLTFATTRSCPLYTYLYKYFTAEMWVTISTFMWHLYLSSRYGL